MTKTLLNAVAGLAIAAATTGADAETSKRVVFENNGERLVGDLYLPDNYRSGDKLPAVVVTGAWMTVKEQMAGRYAAELANRGYAALAFDFRGWGQSEGGRRQLEDPASKIADIKAAVAFLATRAEVDAQRLAALGICASAGYMVHAAAALPQVKSVALVARPGCTTARSSSRPMAGPPASRS
jgi:dienelactone hydrolase